MKTVIIGLGAGGFYAALTLRKYSRDMEIVIIDRKDFDLLHPCGLPYVIEGKVDSFERLKHTLPDMRFEKLLSHEATRIDTKAKVVHARDMKTGYDKLVSYEWLIIATGSGAVVPPVPGAKELLGKGVFCLDSFDEAFRLNEYSTGIGSVVVVGAGAIGLETANALHTRGKDVTVVEMASCCYARSLDPDMASLVYDHLSAKGIRLLFDTKLVKVLGKDKMEGVLVRLADGKDMEISAGMAVMATGVLGNFSFARDSGISCGKWGIIVDEHMMTDVPDVYAIGDIVQAGSLIDKREWMMQLAVAACKQGIVAATDILRQDGSGIREKKYRGALSTFASKIGELEIASTGFNSYHAAKDASGDKRDIVIGKSAGLTKPDWCIGGKQITVKLIVEKASGKILGGQAVGLEGAAHRIDVVSAAIQAGFNIYDLSQTEMCYCPAVSEINDILMQAAENAIRKMG